MINNSTFRKFVYKFLAPITKFNDWRIDHIGIYNGEKRLKRMPNEQADKLITDMIHSGKPFAIVRYGHTEFCCMMNVSRQQWQKRMNRSGVHPAVFPDWEALYWEASKQIDVLAVWNYRINYSAKQRLIKKLPNIKHFIDLAFLEPFEKNWIKALEGKKVLVINPFVKSIELQYSKRELIGILPELEKLDIMKPVVSYCEPVHKFDWLGALEKMKEDIKSRDFDIALIGCGPYGLPLATYVKQLKKQAIHLGGITQLYFGIKGQRWCDKPYCKQKFNEHWIFPLEEDIHPRMKKIENGCYIGPENK